MKGFTWPGYRACKFFPLSAVVVLSGCLSPEESTDTTNPFTGAETEFDQEIAGSVGDGPIVGAAMRVLANDGSVIAELQSDSNAGYNVTVRTKGKFYPLTLDARNGTDIVTNLVPDFEMYGAVIEPGRKAVANLNPFSTFAVGLARNLDGGLNKSNLATAEGIVSRELNSGLIGLADSGPSITPVDETNIAEIIKASETLGETVRRVRDLENATGRSASGNLVVRSVSADLVDGVIDGVGGQDVNARHAALTVIVSAQTFLESMQNELHVNNQVATGAMESAMAAVSAGSPTQSFEDLAVTADMLEAVRVGLRACLAVVPGPDLQALSTAVDSIQVGMAPMTIRSLVPDTYRETLDSAITAIANGTDADITTVNTVSRNGGEIPGTANGVPTITGTPATSVEEGSMYSFTPGGSDPDGDPLTFTITGQPAWADFDPADGTLSGVPGPGTAGQFANIVIAVNDGQATAELPAFTITVTAADAPNSPPTISGSPSTTVEEGANYSFTPTASDPDGDALTYVISGQPAWTSFDTSTGTLSGTPAVGTAGSYPDIVIGVTDGEFTSNLPAFSITVTEQVPPNAPPTISGTPPANVTVGDTYSFTPSASDPDGDPLTFTIDAMPAWAAFDATSGTLSGTPQPGDENIYNDIVIRVSDGELTDSLGPFSIEVTSSGTGTGSATLSWTAPTQNEDGTPLTDLAGYKVYWGTTPGSYPNSVTIDNASVLTYTVDGLTAGTYEFVVTAYNQSGVESSFSTPASKVIP